MQFDSLFDRVSSPKSPRRSVDLYTMVQEIIVLVIMVQMGDSRSEIREAYFTLFEFPEGHKASAKSQTFSMRMGVAQKIAKWLDEYKIKIVRGN